MSEERLTTLREVAVKAIHDKMTRHPDIQGQGVRLIEMIRLGKMDYILTAVAEWAVGESKE